MLWWSEALKNYNHEQPVFIVSSGRSGTTLLRTMLNSGDELHIPHESDFIARAFPVYCQRNDIQESDYVVAISFFRRTSQNSGWGLPFEYLMECLKKKSPNSFKELNIVFAQAYFDYHNLSPDKWGIKAPVLIASIYRILKVFPKAKIVHLVRDGRDVHLSYRAVHQNPDVKSFGPKGVISSALYWTDGLRRVEKFEEQIFQLRYEDLLSNPAIEIKRLCSHLGIRYSPVMYTAYSEAKGNKDALLSEHRKTIHAKIEAGLDASNINKYKVKMKKIERFVFELFASTYLNKYGYELEFPILSYRIISPIRGIAYGFAKVFNDFRYYRRDKAAFSDAKRLSGRWVV